MFLVSLWTGSIQQGFALTFHFSTYTDAVATYSDQFLRSLRYGALATLFAFAIGFPLAYTIAFRGGRYKNLLLFLVIAPFFTSFLLRTLSWKIILADSGLLLGPLKDIGLLPLSFRLLATEWAVIAGITYNFLPFMTLPLYVALEKIDRSVLEAAGDLFASRTQTFLRVTLPLALPGVFAGSLLTFIPAVGDYVNAELLGTTSTQMIGNVIQGRFLTVGDYPTASALSFILMAAILVGVFAYGRFLGTEQLTGGRP
ncbi:MAG: ABC transporter permease [Chloroflexi bacterium]|nr:ABC transporter permease [Chloroflexota bacterium]